MPYNAASKATPPRAQKKTPNYFQPEQVHLIITELDKALLKWRLIAYLLILTGCRRGEIAGIKWSKIDFENKTILIDSALLYSKEKGFYEARTKTRKNRYTKLNEILIPMLEEHLIEQKELAEANGVEWNQNDYLFTQINYNPINPTSITCWMSDFSKELGLPHMNPHAFRHTFISLLLAYKTDIVTVSDLAGHSRVSTTEDIYCHVILEAKAKAMADYSNLILNIETKK